MSFHTCTPNAPVIDADALSVTKTSMDEPTVIAAGQNRRTAGWTVVPVVREMVERVAPMLGLRPQGAAEIDAMLRLR